MTARRLAPIGVDVLAESEADLTEDMDSAVWMWNEVEWQCLDDMLS